MNKLVYSALALTLVSVPGFATENEWSSLDREIANLSASLAQQGTGGPKVGGYVRTSFRESSDITVGTGDQSGLYLDQARIEISGDAGSDYSYKVSFELAGGTGDLRDAYAKWKIAEGVNGKLGRYKIPLFHSAYIGDDRTLFLDRSAIGSFFAIRDLGFEVSGNFDVVDWYVGGMNGDDAQADEYLFYGKVAANLMGNGQGKLEGAYGSGEGSNLTVGVSAADDGSFQDGLVIGAEAYFVAGNFSVSGEIADFDSGPFGTALSKTIQGGPSVLSDVDDSTPFAVTGSFLFTEMYEAALRFEDLDDSESTTVISAAVNRYTQGHDIKWTVQYVTCDSDDATLEVDQFGLGLSVSF